MLVMTGKTAENGLDGIATIPNCIASIENTMARIKSKAEQKIANDGIFEERNLSSIKTLRSSMPLISSYPIFSRAVLPMILSISLTALLARFYFFLNILVVVVLVYGTIDWYTIIGMVKKNFILYHTLVRHSTAAATFDRRSIPHPMNTPGQAIS